MKETITNNGVIYIGFDKTNNGKIIVENKENYNGYTYVIEQRDSFTQAIIGYVIKDGNRYKTKWWDGTWIGAGRCRGDVINYFTYKEEAIRFVIAKRATLPKGTEIIRVDYKED